MLKSWIIAAFSARFILFHGLSCCSSISVIIIIKGKIMKILFQIPFTILVWELLKRVIKVIKFNETGIDVK